METSINQLHGRRKPLNGDQHLDQWEPLLTAWWKRFHDDPITVDELRVALSLDTPLESLPLPTSLMRPRRKGPGALKRSMGRRLAALTGWPIGQFVICDGGRDSLHGVRAWRLKLASSDQR